MKSLTLLTALTSTLALALLTSCEKEAPPAPAAGTAAKTGDDHDHDHESGHGGPVVALGELDAGPFNAKATRDAGDIIAGKDAAFDVTITPKESTGVKAAAVRFWIGTQDAKGSVKAKAEVEDPNDPNRWHTHAEIPSPLPANSQFWFEIEDDKGAKHVAGFDLKM
ncbi:MAG: hypothetical protein ACKVZJ_05945 [Phycisphaerales bacterium]